MPRDQAHRLTKTDLVKALRFCDECYGCGSDDALYALILDIASFLGFEYVLCAYMTTSYDSNSRVHFANLSNPPAWMEEYDANSYVNGDPVRCELEHRLATDDPSPFILWDAYDRELSPREQEIIRRRTFYGLKYGCSVFHNSRNKDAIFLLSLASESSRPDERTRIVGEILVPHLTRCRKRLDMLLLVNRLTERERAVAEHLVNGKTNGEIAQILNVATSTVKYHVVNILTKLEVTNRQNAISVLLAERYLS